MHITCEIWKGTDEANGGFVTYQLEADAGDMVLDALKPFTTSSTRPSPTVMPAALPAAANAQWSSMVSPIWPVKKR